MFTVTQEYIESQYIKIRLQLLYQISYKVKKLRKVEKEKYIRVDNTHETIIDKEIFEKAQIIHKERAKKVAKQYDYLLRGLIYCKYCRLANANCIKSKS